MTGFLQHSLALRHSESLSQPFLATWGQAVSQGDNGGKQNGDLKKQKYLSASIAKPLEVDGIDLTWSLSIFGVI